MSLCNTVADFHPQGSYVRIAVSGKGGAGKTTLAGSLAQLCLGQDSKVFSIDAADDANLDLALGLPGPSQIIPPDPDGAVD
ncbi:MAG: hypothetical protein J7J76_08690 [Candidatus Latescibacteria bacterium]|nr:hypothetical protein [Candidatus Latescibacterota bacterium]